MTACDSHPCPVDLSAGKCLAIEVLECVNGRLRDECPNERRLESPADADEKIDAWRWDYNAHRPHRALQGLSPGQFARWGKTGDGNSPS